MKFKNIFLIIVVGMLMFACAKNPTEQALEQKPDNYIPDWQPGMSVVLNYTWADTSGDGDPEYFGSTVTTAGHVDSVWFNFNEILIVDIDYAVVAIPASGGNAVTLTSGAIPLGKYQYGFNIDKTIANASQFRIVLTAYGRFPLPLSAYLRVTY